MRAKCGRGMREQDVRERMDAARYQVGMADDESHLAYVRAHCARQAAKHLMVAARMLDRIAKCRPRDTTPLNIVEFGERAWCVWPGGASPVQLVPVFRVGGDECGLFAVVVGDRGWAAVSGSMCHESDEYSRDIGKIKAMGRLRSNGESCAIVEIDWLRRPVRLLDYLFPWCDQQIDTKRLAADLSGTLPLGPDDAMRALMAPSEGVDPWPKECAE